MQAHWLASHVLPFQQCLSAFLSAICFLKTPQETRCVAGRKSHASYDMGASRCTYKLDQNGIIRPTLSRSCCITITREQFSDCLQIMCDLAESWRERVDCPLVNQLQIAMFSRIDTKKILLRWVNKYTSAAVNIPKWIDQVRFVCVGNTHLVEKLPGPERASI